MRPLRLVAAALMLGACASEAEEASVRELLVLPDHFEVPAIPDYNPLTDEKITLGRRLFYDTELSANGTQSCASCHEQDKAFADGLAAPMGSTGDRLVRNSQGLANVAYHSTLTWASDGLITLEDQIQIPLLNDNPVELGITDGVRDEVLARFDADPMYQELFRAAFPESQSGATINKIAFALAHFCRSLISGDTPYDRYVNGDRTALTEEQQLGLRLFNGERFECHHCHTGVNLSTAYRDARVGLEEVRAPFFNNGLYNVDGRGAYPAHDQGLYDLTFDPGDQGHFRPQSLRNVALTAPYMHDGSLETLREVVEHYAAGGRNVETGPFVGDGRLSPLKSGLVRGFIATDEEIDAVVAFLESLTDEAFLRNPAHADPFATP
ncbi:MAG: MbnH family di-heme enzyme [Myxococcota bacterium]